MGTASILSTTAQVCLLNLDTWKGIADCSSIFVMNLLRCLPSPSPAFKFNLQLLSVRSLATPPTSSYYDELGLHPQASTREIKNAFYALSKEHHPDRNVENAEALNRFQAISEAYEVLSNPATRTKYDKGVLGRASSVAERERASHRFDGEAFYEGKAAEKVSHQRRKQLDTWMIKNRTEEFEYKQFLKKRDRGLGKNPNQPNAHASVRRSADSRNAKTDASLGGGFSIIVVLAVIIILIRAIS